MQISEKDKILVDSLKRDAEEVHFKHEYELDKQILGLLIADRHFLVESISLIKPVYFEDRSHQLICQIIFDFFSEYKQPPSKAYIQNEVKVKCKNTDQLFMHMGELEAVVLSYTPGSYSREYLMDKVVAFAKEQSVKNAISSTIDMLKQPDPYGKIWELWREALTTDRSQDLGLDYFNTLDERYDRMSEELKGKEIFTSGFPGIDAMLSSKGLCRGEMGCFVGLSGSGKSLCLINSAAANLALGRRVAYITLEMSQDKIAKRFDSLLSQTEYSMLLQDKDIVKKAIREHVKYEEDDRRLIVKHYPGGTANVNSFRAYLSQLGLYGFKPDLVLVDYLGELSIPINSKTYEVRQTQSRELRAFAQEEGHCCLTAIQANRKGREVQQVEGNLDDDSLSESFGILRPMDACYSINKPETGCNVGTLFVIKHRDGISRQEICYKTDYRTLLMSEIHREEFKTILADYRKAKISSVQPKQIEI